MTLEQFAKKLDGREYGWPQFTKEEIAIAKENGFVIVYGVSDDLMEVDGAIHDEAGCFKGGTLKLDIADKKFVDRKTEESCDVISIKAYWCEACNEYGQTIPWTYATDVSHEKFMIYEDGDPYCLGFIFQNDALREPVDAPKSMENRTTMKVRELLKSLQSRTKIHIIVPYTGNEFKCDNPEQAILNYGHEAVKNWFVIDNMIYINLEEQS